MESLRFDELTRALALSRSRRRFLRLGSGLAVLVLVPRGVAARQREPDADPGAEPPLDPKGSRPAFCPDGVACADTCCPPETVACVPPLQLPDETTGQAGCLCPDGFAYLNERCALCPDRTTCFGRGCGDEQICLEGRCCGVYNAPCCTDDDCCFGHCSKDAICLCFHPVTPCDADEDCCIGGCIDGVCEIPR